MTLGDLRQNFLALNRATPRTAAERQQRGYDVEQVLAGLFQVHDIDYWPSYRIPGEQIDDSFHFRDFTYLTEVRSRSLPPDAGDLLTFNSKTDGKLESTRGLFVSVAGFDSAVLDHVFRIARGTRNNVLLFDGRDVALLFEGHIGVIDALTAKVDAADGKAKCGTRSSCSFGREDES